ncbi:MAG: tetratricopeptide repeat protein [Clostridiales Family XIII bacterium]|jgi:tetratricopeptide (TPR) repeat protein|nr:tetratricopeptide repeat protein [Clostridiales Family XIII bacterium]
MTPEVREAITNVLGLPLDADEGRIRAAYLEKLPDHHPEDDPDGFRRLRDAYELALEHLRRPEEEEGEEEDPFLTILRHFPSRLSEDAWKEAFAKEDLSSIDALVAVGDRLAGLLMEDYYIPQRIWQLFDSIFEWTAQEKRLKETFPEGFIDYVYSGIRFEKYIRDDFFDLSDPDADFQGFLDRFYEVDRALGEGDAEKAKALIDQSEGPLYGHPDFRLLVVRYLNMAERDVEAEALARELYEAYPGDERTQYALGHALVMSGKPAEALGFFRKVLEDHPKHYNARVGVVRALFDMEEYEEAKAAGVEMLLEYYFDSYVSALFHAASERLVPVYEEQLAKDPDDQGVRYKLASCLFNEGRYDEATALIQDVEPSEEHRAKHAELLFDGILVTQGAPKAPDDAQAEQMVAYLREWEAHETVRMRLRYLPDKYRSIGRLDEALEKAEFYLGEFPDDTEILFAVAQTQRARGETGEAYKTAFAALAQDDGHPGLLGLLAHLYEDDGSYSEAAEKAEAALHSFPYSIEMREMLARIYRRAGMAERVLELAEEAGEMGIETDDLALAKADAVIALGKGGAEIEEAVKTLQGLLKKDPENRMALETLGDYYSGENRAAEAYACFDKLIKLAEAPYYYLSRGWLFANFPAQFGTYAEAHARADFAKALELDERYAPAYYQLGFMAFHAGDYEEAAGHFERTLAFAPDFRGAHYYLAFTYTQLGRPEDAVGVCDDGIGIFGARAEAQEGGEAQPADKETLCSLLWQKYFAWYYNHRYEEAVGVVEEAGLNLKELEEGLPDAKREAARRLGDIAMSYYEVGDDGEAERLLLMALAEFPDDALLNRKYAEFLLHGRRDAAKAVRYYELAAAARDGFRIQVELAKAYAAAGRARDAQKRFRAALKRGQKKQGFPDAPKGTPCNEYLTGECLYGLGKPKKALPHLLRALETSCSYPECVKRSCFEAAFTLALLYLSMGDGGKAREYYEIVTGTVPDREYREAAGAFNGGA